MSIPSSGSSTLRSASITSSCVGTGTSLAEPYVLAPLAREEVDAVDEAHPVAAGAHHERVRARRVGEVAHAAQQLAARDAGGGNDHLLRREVVDREDALDVLDAVGAGRLDLRPPRRPELRLELAAEAAEGGRGEHRLPGAADPDREVVVRAADRDGHRREDVAVLDQLDARPDATDLLDQVVVARAVEHDRGDVRRRPAVGVGDRADGVRDRGVSETAPRARGPTASLRMYMSGSSGIDPRGPAAIIEIALPPPRATTARPSSGSIARSTSSPPAPIAVPAARDSAPGGPPITIWPLTGSD